MRLTAAAGAATAALFLVGLTACAGAPTEVVDETTGESPGSPGSPATEVADGGGAAGSDPGPVAAALALAPQDASWLTLTDWARIKERLGADHLTSESIQTDRIEFWRAVPNSTVLLTDGVLREENSRLGIRYAVTQDDALWEVRWTGGSAADGAGDGDVDDTGGGAAHGDEDGAAGVAGPRGLALRLRDDLDLDGLQRAVADQVTGLAGAQVLPEEHLLLRGAAEGAGLAGDPAMVAALDLDAETQLAAPGCLGWPTALGVDATVEDQEALADPASLDALLDPEAWGMAFTGREAQVTVVYPEGTSAADAERDAEARLALAEEWPTTESVGWGDAFGLPPGLSGAGFVVEDEGGRVRASADYRVVNPTAAATVVLAGLVPWAVCADVDWLAEPTGLS